jgi:hypothetical protein
MTPSNPLTTSLNYAAIFAQRIQQLINFYELATPELAHQIGLDPQALAQLLLNQPVHQQIVLQLMDGSNNATAWNLTDLSILLFRTSLI